MYAHVSPQAAPCGEGSIADQTLEGLQASVCPDMCFEHSCRDEASTTLRTFERFLTRM